MKYVPLSTGIEQKPIARELMILLVALTLGTAVGTSALAAGPIGGGGGGHGGGGGFGGGGHGGGGGFGGGGGPGGGHPGGGFGGGHMGGGFGGQHAGGSPMGGLGSSAGGIGSAHLGSFGGTDSRGIRFGGDHNGDHHFGGDHDGHNRFGGDHDGRRRFGGGFIGGTYGYFPSYDDYGYDNFGDYANDGTCFQYRHIHTAAGWRWRQVWVCN